MVCYVFFVFCYFWVCFPICQVMFAMFCYVFLYVLCFLLSFIIWFPICLVFLTIFAMFSYMFNVFCYCLLCFAIKKFVFKCSTGTVVKSARLASSGQPRHRGKKGPLGPGREKSFTAKKENKKIQY